MFASLTEKSTTKKCESYCKKCSSLWYPSPPPPSIICGRWGPEYQEEGGGCTVQARNCTKVVSILSLVCSVLILLCFSCCGERSLQSFHCQTRIWLKVENCQIEVERQRINIPTQGQRVAETGDERLFSLTAPGSDPQLGIKPRPHWWETDALPIGQLSTQLFKVD